MIRPKSFAHSRCVLLGWYEIPLTYTHDMLGNRHKTSTKVSKRFDCSSDPDVPALSTDTARSFGFRAMSRVSSGKPSPEQSMPKLISTRMTWGRNRPILKALHYYFVFFSVAETAASFSCSCFHRDSLVFAGLCCAQSVVLTTPVKRPIPFLNCTILHNDVHLWSVAVP